jgi:uncharacterized Fe-S cluster protein YjdI
MKEYSGKEITVSWDPSKCIHARECVKGLPQVFDREKTPWINIKGAGEEEIMKVIDRCPSGALSYKKSTDSPSDPFAQIKITKNGPLLVEGNCILMDSEGQEKKHCGPFALCRCGGSKNKPFCDGTHGKIDFDDTK